MGKTIDDFSAVVTPATTDVLLCSQSNITRKLTVSQIVSAISATDAQAIAGIITTKFLTPANLSASFASRTATLTTVGLVELATSAEALTGTDASRVITPSTLNTVLTSEIATLKTGIQDDSYNYCAISGTNTYTGTMSPTIATYVQGMKVKGKVVNANTATLPTLNLNSVGAKKIYKEGTSALSVGDIPAGHHALFSYETSLDTNSGGWLILNPKTTGSPVGTVIQVAMDTAPYEYLECDGTAISRSTYSVLFGVIGTTFGEGNGTTTFNIPDLRGEFIRGWDHERGVDVGRTFGTAQADELKAHKHLIAKTSDGYNGASGGDGVTKSAGLNTDIYSSDTGGTETRPRNIALMYCIKYI